MFMMRTLLLLAVSSCAGSTLCQTAAECGLIEGMCGSVFDAPLKRLGRTTICLGFQPDNTNSTAAATKAQFSVRVDRYSALSVDTGAASLARNLTRALPVPSVLWRPCAPDSNSAPCLASQCVR